MTVRLQDCCRTLVYTRVQPAVNRNQTIFGSHRLKINIYLSDILSERACLHHKNCVTDLIGYPALRPALSLRIDERVAVTAYDYVNILRPARNVKILRSGSGVVPYVSERHNHIHLLVMLEMPRRGICSLDTVKIPDTGAVCRRNHSLRLKIYRYKTDFPVAVLLDGIWSEVLGKRSGRHIVVRCQPSGFTLADLPHKGIHSRIELMIAEYLDVIAHVVHELTLYLAAKQSVVQSTLHSIARIYKQHIVICLPHAVDNHLAAQYTAHAVACRVYRAVGVVGVQYHKIIGYAAHSHTAGGKHRNQFF